MRYCSIQGAKIIDGYSNFLKKTVVEIYINIYIYNIYYTCRNILNNVFSLLNTHTHIYMCVCMCACVSVYMIHTKKIRRNQQLVVGRCPA